MHRITTMLQSGLLIIAAGLGIAGVVVWMNGLTFAVQQADAELIGALIDSLALGFLGAGCFMAGAVTAWIGIDLARLQMMSWLWLLPFTLAGICLLPAPFLLPAHAWLVVVGAILWGIGAMHIALRRNIPHAYAEWS